MQALQIPLQNGNSFPHLRLEVKNLPEFRLTGGQYPYVCWSQY
jgi:hypothetical protein